MTNYDNMASQIAQMLTSLAPTECELIDDSHKHAGHAGAKSGGHFRLTVVSSQFEGLSLVARHRLVFSLLDTLMRTRIHALSITALTPAERTR